MCYTLISEWRIIMTHSNYVSLWLLCFFVFYTGLFYAIKLVCKLVQYYKKRNIKPLHNRRWYDYKTCEVKLKDNIMDNELLVRSMYMEYILSMIANEIPDKMLLDFDEYCEFINYCELMENNNG